MWETWIADLVKTYSIDGIRLDSARQVDQAFFAPFQNAGMLPFSFPVNGEGNGKGVRGEG